jgi:putative membrane protein
MDRRSVLLALAGVVSTASIATAQPLLSTSPSQFRLSELMGGEFAILTSRLALERSRNPSVRNFAQLEINEQTAVAAALGATPGGVQPRPDQMAIIQQLQSMGPGRQFDRAYVEGQIAGHEELLALNTAYAQGGSDERGRAVATIAVPHHSDASLDPKQPPPVRHGITGESKDGVQ